MHYGNGAQPFRHFLRAEWFLGVSAGTSVIFGFAGPWLFTQITHPAWLLLLFVWLFIAIMGSSFGVVRHADYLAVRLGEPYGTLLLTLSMTFIEVSSIAAVMLHGDNNPMLARDTLFAVVMIVLNGMVGLSLLLGGWRHREQHYNLQGANAYLGVIIPLIVLSLLLPDFTQSTPGPTLSVSQQVFLVLVAVGLYSAFLVMQVGRHRVYFTLGDDVADEMVVNGQPRRLLPHALLLIVYLLPVVFLAEQLAHPVDYLIETLGAPDALGGVVIALLVATPEGIGAVRAALANHMQRSVNVFLGSILSTIGLTIPVMVVVSNLIGRNMVLGVQHTDLVMLLLTLTVSVVTFASGSTNVIQGAVHLILFAVYLALLIQG